MTTPTTPKPETFGGLLRPDETPEDALRRLERRKDYTKVIGSDDGQRLLEAATAQTKAIPNGGVKPKRPRRVVDPEKTPDEELAERSEAVAGFRANLVDLGFVVSETPQPGDRLESIPLELVDVGDNVRMDPGELEAFAASIRELGVLQPVKATRQPDGRYLLRWGQRRVLAAREAGLTEIPAIVAGGPEPGAGVRAIEQLVENLDRKDLNPLEEASALRAVLDADPELTQQALAERLGRSPSWLSNTLRILETDERVQEGVRAGKITASHAKALVVLPPTEQRELAERIERGLSAHQLEQTISWKVDEHKRAEATRTRTDKQIPKAIAALEAAEIGKDHVVVPGYSYNLDNERLQRAIKAAGWKLEHGTYGRAPGAESKCDCKAVRLDFNRKWVVERACVDVKHVDRQVNANHVVERAARKQQEQELAALRAAMRAALEVQPPHPVIARLLARQVDGYSAREWAHYAALPISEILDSVADILTAERTVLWPYERPVPIAQVITELGGAAPERRADRDPKVGDRVAAGAEKLLVSEIDGEHVVLRPPSYLAADHDRVARRIASTALEVRGKGWRLRDGVELPAPVADGQVEAFDDVDVKPAGPVNVDELRGEAERSVES